jgi:hypothetical protein
MYFNVNSPIIIQIIFEVVLSWYVHDAAHVIATKIAKKNLLGVIEAKAYYFRSLCSHGLVMSW